MDVNRISEMESYLDECTAATEALTAQLRRMAGLGEEIGRAHV